jgi:peptide chain release factor 2
MIETNPILAQIADLRAASSRLGGIFDYATKRERLEEVSRELESPSVWDDPARAQELGRERARLDTIVSGIDTLDGRPH